eukprot:Gb_03024 [translate_table: standard]
MSFLVTVVYMASKKSHNTITEMSEISGWTTNAMIVQNRAGVLCVQWHVNCNYIATGSSDKTVRLWDVQSGECVRMFIGHRGMVLSIAMSPDGRYMASGDEDGAIMMWDLSSGRCVTPLMGHTSCVWTLAFRNLALAPVSIGIELENTSLAPLPITKVTEIFQWTKYGKRADRLFTPWIGLFCKKLAEQRNSSISLVIDGYIAVCLSKTTLFSFP